MCFNWTVFAGGFLFILGYVGLLQGCLKLIDWIEDHRVKPIYQLLMLATASGIAASILYCLTVSNG